MSTRSEHGRLEFLSFAARARTRGRRGGALLFWLLRERKAAFITQSDEDDAAGRLRHHLNAATVLRAPEPSPAASPPAFSPDEQFIVACIRTANKHGLDPFHVARQVRGWTRDEWDEAHHAHVQAQHARWDTGGEE
ncbi:MAG: hypothetical protein AAFN41_13965 [Planctomycetota bacterium]